MASSLRRICVVGSGAREHALCRALARSADVIATPGSPGISGESSEGYRLSSTSAPAESIDADLYVIGPEVPLVEGLADRLRAAGRLVFGPGRDGAALEGSKAFMKSLAERANVPTARYGVFSERSAAERFLSSLPGPYVVKTDGLAAGKGVLVTDELDEARADVAEKLSGRSFGGAGRRVVIEEGLFGEELSLLVLCDGKRLVALPPAQDYKRAYEGGAGPNTGGMGAYSPVPVADEGVVEEVMDRIVEPTVTELNRQGVDYRGVLYAGLMLTEAGPKLIEYNVRFGDPEAEVVLPRLEGDIAGLLAEVAGGSLRSTPSISPRAAVCVVACANGYPERSANGELIEGLERASQLLDVEVFHAGTALSREGAIVATGGRVLAVSALGTNLSTARARAYEAIDVIGFDGMRFRRDIALDVAEREAVKR